MRVDVLVAALRGDGINALGAVGLSGLRTLLREFPSVRQCVLLCSEDIVSPLEAIVFRVSAAKMSNYYKLTDWIAWEAAECANNAETATAAEECGYTMTIDQLGRFAD